MNTSTPSAAQTPFEHEVAEHMVTALQLEVTPEQILPEAPLFGDGLGLDSIDALEIALVIGQEYGVTLRSDDPENARIYRSLRSLCAYVEGQRAAR